MSNLRALKLICIINTIMMSVPVVHILYRCVMCMCSLSNLAKSHRFTNIPLQRTHFDNNCAVRHIKQRRYIYVQPTSSNYRAYTYRHIHILYMYLYMLMHNFCIKSDAISIKNMSTG